MDIQHEVDRIRKESTVYQTRRGVLKDTLKLMHDGDILEFGVYTGVSTSFIAENYPERKIYAFDSFEGLPEAWPGDRSRSHKKGHFNVNGKLPQIDHKYLKFIRGWFNDTLPIFTAGYTSKVALIHIDCDIYSSTKTIFKYMRPYIQPGTIILFDELIGYKDFEINEMQAWLEFVYETSVKYNYLYSAKEQVSLRIL